MTRRPLVEDDDGVDAALDERAERGLAVVQGAGQPGLPWHSAAWERDEAGGCPGRGDQQPRGHGEPGTARTAVRRGERGRRSAGQRLRRSALPPRCCGRQGHAAGGCLQRPRMVIRLSDVVRAPAAASSPFRHPVGGRGGGIRVAEGRAASEERLVAARDHGPPCHRGMISARRRVGPLISGSRRTVRRAPTAGLGRSGRDGAGRDRRRSGGAGAPRRRPSRGVAVLLRSGRDHRAGRRPNSGEWRPGPCCRDSAGARLGGELADGVDGVARCRAGSTRRPPVGVAAPSRWPARRDSSTPGRCTGS